MADATTAATTTTAPPTPSTATERTHVLIVGSGFSGLGMGLELLGRGDDDFVILDRGSDLGGTWRDNTYPEAACDIPGHLYSLSSVLHPDWTRAYAGHAEIQAYLQSLATDHGLRPHLRFDAAAVSAVWDDASATWTVETRDGRRFVADVLVSAIGGLRDPLYPRGVDRSRFQGPQFHSSRWDHNVDLEGKRVGVVGTGASAIQLVPPVAEVAAHTTVFQRTAPWVIPRRNRRFTRIERWAHAHVPGFQRLYRTLLYLQHEVFYFAVFNARAPLTPIVERLARAFIRREIEDPELADQLTPDFRFGCKRVLKSNEWYAALARPDVTTVTSGVAEVTETGVVTEDGQHVEFDVLVWATGFSVEDFLGELEVTGRDDADLKRTWGTRPLAWMGHTVPGFPNLFLLLGPNTALGHNSVVLMAEAQIAHAAKAIAHLDTSSGDILEVRRDRLDAYTAELDERFGGHTWASGCSSWYLNDRGENFTLWPGSVIEYRRRASQFDVAAYEERQRTMASAVADDELDRVSA